ncbi:MAG: hypothetical protein ACOWW1_06305 [archaeon]
MARKTKRKYEQSEMGHNNFMKTEKGRKLIEICRILAKKWVSINEIIGELESKNLNFSRSQIYKLLDIAQESQWVLRFPYEKPDIPRGRPTGGIERKTGRPNYYYKLSSKGLFYMRFDPDLVDNWEKVEEAYSQNERHSMLDSFNSLCYAIQQHSKLNKFKGKPDFDGVLQRRPLNPLLFERGLENEEFEELSDELVRLIKENVLLDCIKPYRSSLEDSLNRLKTIAKRHQILIEKIKNIEKI